MEIVHGEHVGAKPSALVIPLGTSFTPGAPGPYTREEPDCPLLDVPAGYVQRPTEQENPDQYSCSWEGEADTASAPPLDTSSRLAVPGSRYGGKRIHHCRGGAVEICAEEVGLPLTWPCDGLCILGERNSVWVQKADTVQLTGRRNTVWCREPASEVYDLPGVAYGEPPSGMLLGCRP